MDGGHAIGLKNSKNIKLGKETIINGIRSMIYAKFYMLYF
jgi:hypothetical protein